MTDEGKCSQMPDRIEPNNPTGRERQLEAEVKRLEETLRLIEEAEPRFASVHAIKSIARAALAAQDDPEGGDG